MAVEAAIRGLFTNVGYDGLLIACAHIESLQVKLPATEFACVVNAAPKRQREFTAGRVLARTLARQLGVEYCSLIRQQDRTPAWPETLTGSITHCQTYCAVAVGRKELYPAVGLDIETIGRVELDLWESVFTEREIEYLETLPTEQAVYAATAIFSAKESYYKFQYNYTQAWVEFHDIEVVLIDDQRGYLRTLHKDLAHLPPAVVWVQAVDRKTLATLICNEV